MGKLTQGLYEESVTPNHRLGELYIDPWGRKFRYVQAGGSALVTGNLLQEPAENTDYRSMAVQAAVAIGAKTIPVTLGSTAATVDQFKDGDLVVESSTGIGQVFKIVSNDAASGGATCTLTVDRPVLIALTTSSQVSVRKNASHGVIQFPTTPTGGPVGVALYAMTASYYGWIQSGGDCAVLFDNQGNSAADQTAIIPSLDVAGSVRPALAADVAPLHIGWSREMVSVDSTMGMAHLIID